MSFYLAQRRYHNGEWQPIISYPGSKYVGLSPSLEEVETLISCWREYPNMFMQGMEYRVLRFELPYEVMT